MVFLAENYLERLGIKVKTEYGNYIPTYMILKAYMILKDLGKYLSKKNIECTKSMITATISKE